MAALLESLDAQLHPEHTALLVIDMQNDFCAEDGYLSKRRDYKVGFAAGVADRIKRLMDAVRPLGVRIVWVRSIYDFKYLTPAYRVKRGEEGCCLENTWGADYFRIAPEEGDVVIDKHSFSGFHNTKLHELLQREGIKTLVLAGVATNVCVDSTLREGFFLGYSIVLAEDCVGSNSKVGHEGTLATVRNNIGTVIDSREIARLLGGSLAD
ncbi:cysteine hydrolase family protein [Pusillimonas sp.]|uniref:cysteine hydrolase family protein n=1 Tax=Pusillimonas sp. TaxID=3040095 RepID=UPI0037C7AEC5